MTTRSISLIPTGLQNASASLRPARRISFLFAVVMVEVLALSSTAFGMTWYIKPDGTGDAPTIQAGVDAASAGDIVLVAAGTYPTTSMVDIGGTLTAVCVAIDKDIDLLL